MRFLTLLTSTGLPILAAAYCNHTASDGVGAVPVANGTCGACITIHPSPQTGICGDIGAMCTADTDCTNDYWCCGGHCIGTCSPHGIQHLPANWTTNPIGKYNGTTSPVDIYTGAASKISVGLGVMGVAAGVVAALF